MQNHYRCLCCNCICRSSMWYSGGERLEQRGHIRSGWHFPGAGGRGGIKEDKKNLACIRPYLCVSVTVSDNRWVIHTANKIEICGKKIVKFHLNALSQYPSTTGVLWRVKCTKFIFAFLFSHFIRCQICTFAFSHFAFLPGHYNRTCNKCLYTF